MDHYGPQMSLYHLRYKLDKMLHIVSLTHYDTPVKQDCKYAIPLNILFKTFNTTLIVALWVR